ncbi:hypothetical protein AsAng_0063040 [Aureispira anguillae]|uniref:Uncharacterized protein n=1 Tax=Aureispira anguillae TaxID=2864201 RepID=A0A916DX93_9BACT|nr:hypothetical protein AsAng_0063040 [Aureispira anguillae]
MIINRIQDVFLLFCKKKQKINGVLTKRCSIKMSIFGY